MLPTQPMVKSPTHLILTVAPRNRPVVTSQNHQEGEKALEGPSSCWVWKQVHVRAVRAVAVTRGESSKIKRLFVRSPFSVSY